MGTHGGSFAHALQSGLVVSLSLGGALVGSAAALVWGDKLGRKKELLLAAALYGRCGWGGGWGWEVGGVDGCVLRML